MTTSAGPHVGILLFDGAEELDAVGPFEVLAAWTTRSALQPTVTTFSRDGAGVRLAHGLRIVPAAAADDVGPLHLLIHPGGPGAGALRADAEHLQSLRRARATTPVVAGVGTGALVLAAAGLLAGRPATTHHVHYDELAAVDPSVVVDTEARFVDDGDVVTSAGGIAGIDMALHLVARFESVTAARAVRSALAHESATGSERGM
ncbi:DJ-1/PfpI family protein [Xylanimonas allomyrinae]|uniref:DJ-1/PfpI family protein n=1 Tax=Xylanimonas allomyrinae TaxID=2509459 RepID=A0A4P6EK16_9MICO|nr:DJ-1/PfpI family protein [Xylanimonas allomyrinae]QAY62924.1 DJ-1/PfpI family protein [Xylanimonas allomyrinae]